MTGAAELRDEVGLLCACLSLQPPGPESRRADPFADPGRWHAIWSAGLPRGLMPALAHRLAPDCDPGPVAHPPPADATHAEMLLRDHLAGFRARRLAQWLALTELTAALNAAGIEPLLGPGAQEIWLEAPAWHYARDLGLLIAGGELAAARRAARERRFEEVVALDRSPWRREIVLYRPDISGWIALRPLEAGPGIERLLPARLLLGASRRVEAGAARARAPAPHHGLLLAMLAAPAPARWRSLGRRPPLLVKQVYELAESILALDDAGREQLLACAAQRPGLREILLDWVAAAAAHLAMPLSYPLDGEREALAGRARPLA